MIFELSKDNFLEQVKKDKYNSSLSYCRFPIRFILLESFKDLRDIVEVLKDRSEIFDITTLENFVDNVDGWITFNSIINKIKDLSLQKDYIILLLSEFARFLPDEEFFSFFSSLMSLENIDVSYYQRRLYIPLVGVTQRFLRNFWDKYHRKDEFVSVWKILGQKEKYTLLFVNFNFKKTPQEFTLVESSKEFLNIWKKIDIKNKIICKSALLYLYSPKVFNDEFFEVKRINNIQEYLSEVLKIRIPFLYKEEDNKFWETLLEKIEKSKVNNFFDFVEEYLNVKSLEKINPIILWFQNESDFARWLIKNYYLSNPEFEGTYIKEVFSSIKSYSLRELLEKFFFKIFERDFKAEMIKERKKILREFYDNKRETDFTFIEKPLENKLNSISKEEIPKYITGITSFEKEWIIENLTSFKDIKSIYPELEFYLGDLGFSDILTEKNSWIEEYFKEYRFSRIRNNPSEKLISILYEKNANAKSFYEWYYSFNSVEEYIGDEDEKIWIDALGVEFLPLIISLLKEKGYYVKFKIARAKLPSSTEFNKIENIDRVSDLDEFIHNPSKYRYPKNLIEEIEIIRRIIDRISELRDKFVIFSDHGFTAFANREFKEKRLPDLKFIEGEVRYALLKEDMEISEDEDFFVYEGENSKNKEKYLITLKYHSFSFFPSGEVHGGATPEEVLIPVIYASKVPFEEVSYEVKLLSEEISVREPILRFIISPKLQTSLRVSCENTELNIQYNKENDLYQVDLSKFKPGKYRLTISIGSWKDEKNITIKGGLIERNIL